jgi:hypothetical protein
VQPWRRTTDQYLLFSCCSADVCWESAESATGTGLPSAVDGASVADGALLSWKKRGGNEIGKGVRLGLDELS